MSETSVANDTSDAHVPSQQELDLLFGPSYDEFFTAEEEHLQNDEFTNPFCTPIQEVAESSSHNIGNSNVHTFNQPQVSEYRWTKDHPLEQLHGNPSKPVQTRRQLATYPKMCMFALTVSTVKPKNIKKTMADSVWIEAMHEEHHRFDRLHVWELVDKPFGKTIIRLKWLWKNKKDEDQTVIRNKARLVAKGKALYGLKQAPRAWYDELLKFLTSKGFTKGFQIHQSPHGIFINQAKYALKILHKHGMEKGQSIGTPMATKPKLDADLNGNPVDQTDYRSKIRSKKQDCTAMPSVEAEYMALFASCAQVMWMRTQLQDYGLQYNKIPLYCDSQSAIAISCNPIQHSRTKHIHTQYNYIKEQVENGIIELYFIRTEYQLADMFTKALPEDGFKYLVRRIGMRCLAPAELEVLAKESA
nr:retrotransposon protein, putative, unclassified [Tanacetum cinerariifolium]